MRDGHLAILSPIEEELRKLREETNAEMLRQELDRERQRRMELEQKVQEVLKARYPAFLRALACVRLPQPPTPPAPASAAPIASWQQRSWPWRGLRVRVGPAPTSQV